MSDIVARLALLDREVSELDGLIDDLEKRLEQLVADAENAHMDPATIENIKARYDESRAEATLLRRRSAEQRRQLEALRAEVAALSPEPVKLDGLPRSIAGYLDEHLNKPRMNGKKQ